MVYLAETDIERMLDRFKDLPIGNIPAERVNSEILAHVNENIDAAISENQKRARKLEMKRRRGILIKKMLTEGGIWDKISYLFDYIDTFF